MLSLADTTFIVTDIETTGHSAQQHRVTEVACVYVEGGEIVEERSTLVNPEQYIPQAIQQMTGITNTMVLDAPKGEAIFPTIRTWLDAGSAFVAHNVTFDFNFLEQSFARHNLPGIDIPRLCTVRLGRRLLPARRGFALHKLAGYFGIRIRDRHRALGDAMATAQVLLSLLEIAQDEHDCETMEDVLSIQYKGIRGTQAQASKAKSLGPKLYDIPAAPGVYRMLDARGTVLYIGKAKNLRSRVASYFRPGADHTRKIKEMVKRVRTFDIEETGSELGALLLEARLIKERQPKYNTMQKRERRYSFLKIDFAEEFPRPELSREVEQDGAVYFGPFRNREGVEALIEILNKLFRIRDCEKELPKKKNAEPCMYHHMDRCDAPCAGLVTSEVYKKELERARHFLSGAEGGIVGLMEQKMQEHAERLEFEEAALLRDRVDEMRRVFIWKERIAESVNTNNVIIMLPAPRGLGQELFMVRFGRLADQITVAGEIAEKELRERIEKVYLDGQTAPPELNRIEIDEIRIINGYLRQKKGAGNFVYVQPGNSAAELAAAVRKGLAEGLQVVV